MHQTFYSSAEVASRLGITPRHLGDLRRRGEIEYVQVGRLVKFSEEQVADFISANTVPARVLAFVERSRRASRVPAHVEDPDALRTIASALA